MKNNILTIGAILGTIYILNKMIDKKDSASIGSIGPFGKRYTQFFHDAGGAIDFLMVKQEGEAVAALYYKNKKYGIDIDIDLPWGYEGNNREDGFGLSKIIKYHSEVLQNMQEILDKMDVKQISKNKIYLYSKHYRATIKLIYDDIDKNWLLTIYKKER